MVGSTGAGSISQFAADITTRTSSGTDNGAVSYGWTINTGATALVTRTLPATPTNLLISYLVTDTDGIKVQASTGDVIVCLDKSTAGGGYLQSTTVGSYVTLLGTDASTWYVVGIGGVWTDGTFTFDNTGLTTP